MSLPPLEPLRRVLAALETAGMAPVVGGSALLVALGLAETANDWDVVVDADPDAVAAALEAAGVRVARTPGHPPFESAALFAVDSEGAAIDVIVGFAIRGAGGALVEIPARPGTPWRGLPMAHPDDWVRAYAAMGRPERAALLRSRGR